MGRAKAGNESTNSMLELILLVACNMMLATLPGAVAPTTVVVAMEIPVRSTCRSIFLSIILSIESNVCTSSPLPWKT